MRPFVILALLAVTSSALAQTPPPTASAPAAAPPVAAPVPTVISNPVLDGLVHSPQIVGITRQDGTRFLGRVVGGDHGVYIVQTFHFAGPPRAGSRTVGSGRKRRTIHTYVDTTIKDETAVRLLVAGVAGSNVHPREIWGDRQLLTGQDIRLIQALSPPPSKSPAPAVAVTTPPAATQAAWTLTTLWPTTGAGEPFLKRKRHHHKSIP